MAVIASYYCCGCWCCCCCLTNHSVIPSPPLHQPLPRSWPLPPQPLTTTITKTTQHQQQQQQQQWQFHLQYPATSTWYKMPAAAAAATAAAAAPPPPSPPPPLPEVIWPLHPHITGSWCSGDDKAHLNPATVYPTKQDHALHCFSMESVVLFCEIHCRSIGYVPVSSNFTLILLLKSWFPII